MAKGFHGERSYESYLYPSNRPGTLINASNSPFGYMSIPSSSYSVFIAYAFNARYESSYMGLDLFISKDSGSRQV